MIKEIDTAGYDSMDKSGVMLVEFYSKTCGPCKMLSFVLKTSTRTTPISASSPWISTPIRTSRNAAA